MTTPTPPDPHAQGSRPLSDDERDALSGLEARMNESDPALSARMGRSASPLGGLSSRTYNRLVQALVVVVVAVVLLPAAWAAVVLMMAIMAGSGVLMLYVARREARRAPRVNGADAPE